MAKWTLPTSTDPFKKQVGGNHYKDLAIQPIDYIMQNGLGWCEGNIVKYITRHSLKGGRKDIEKVIHYAEMLLAEYDERNKDEELSSGDPAGTVGTGSISVGL